MLLISFLIVISICCKSTTTAQGYPPRKSPPPPPSPPQPPSNTYLPTTGASSGNGVSTDDFMPSGPPIPIIRMMAKLNLDGSYNYEYETGNGITVMETGQFIKGSGTDEHGVKTASGFFSYTSPEGKAISVNYIADENGFQPQGDHLPTPPPVPPEIQELIDSIAAGGGCDEGGGTPGNGAIDPMNGGYVY